MQLDNRDYGILKGTRGGDKKISFNIKNFDRSLSEDLNQYYTVATNIAAEFGFDFQLYVPSMNDADFLDRSSDTHKLPDDAIVFEYPHEFRVFCCKERYPDGNWASGTGVLGQLLKQMRFYLSLGSPARRLMM